MVNTQKTCHVINYTSVIIMVILRREDRQDRRRGERRAPRLTRRIWVVGLALVLVVIALTLLLVFSTGSKNSMEGLPSVGDHFHAKYAVRICGEKVVDFPMSEGGVHTHGDGLIHIHPKHIREAGLNATIARFMAGTGTIITDTSLTLPSGETYANGNKCPNGMPGIWQLKLNDTFLGNIAEYVPRDQDDLEILFIALE